jgi:esterase/lipase superfamily enzyme
LFNGERGPKPQMMDITVSFPVKRNAGTLQWPKRLPASC